MLPVKSKQWINLEQNPLLADNISLERLFSGKEGVYFVDTGKINNQGNIIYKINLVNLELLHER